MREQHRAAPYHGSSCSSCARSISAAPGSFCSWESHEAGEGQRRDPQNLQWAQGWWQDRGAAHRALPERAMRLGAGLAARVTRIVTCFSLLWLKANRKSDCCWEWGRKIHFHPENWAQPVPTSAPLAGAQPGSAATCKHGVVVAPLPCWELFGVPRGQGAGAEPPIPCRGWGRAEALQLASKPGLGRCHITPRAPSQARRLLRRP